MRISDWSSDVCSSDLHCRGRSGIRGSVRTEFLKFRRTVKSQQPDLDPDLTSRGIAQQALSLWHRIEDEFAQQFRLVHLPLVGGYGIKQAAADQHDELSAGTRDRDVETLRRKYEISLGQGEFGIGDAIGQYDCVAFLALNPVDGFYEGTATQSLGQGIADGGALSPVGTDWKTGGSGKGGTSSVDRGGRS